MIARENQSRTKVYTTARISVGFSIGISVLFLIFGATIVLPAALRSNGPPLWFAVLWTVGVVALMADTLRTVVEIRVRPDDSVELRSVRGNQTVLPVQAIRAVRTQPFSPYWITVEHAKGKTRILLPVQDLYEFLGWLKQRNPEVKISWL